MKGRTLIGVWKANLPQWVWPCFPLWIGAIFFALGRAPTLSEWGPIALFLVTVTLLIGIAEYSNTYADRDEDWIYVPSNPLVTGELAAGTAKKALILQNILAGLLLIALLVITLNYYLILAMMVGWLVALTYSLPPFRFKERVVAPFFFALGSALVPIVAWLCVEPSLTVKNGFIIAFAAFLFLGSFASVIPMTKLRKTFDALNCGQIQVEESGSVYNIRTVGLKLKVKTAIALEVIAGLGAFILVPIFWHLGIFDMALSIALLTLPLAFTILAVVLGIKDPVRNARKCEQLVGMASLFIVLSFFAVALTSVVHWGFAILACFVFLAGFILLFKVVHPFGPAYRAI